MKIGNIWNLNGNRVNGDNRDYIKQGNQEMYENLYGLQGKLGKP